MAEPTLASVLDLVHVRMATDARDWSTDQRDAFLYGVLVGWDSTGAVDEIAERHGWPPEKAARMQEMRRVIARASSAAEPLQDGRHRIHWQCPICPDVRAIITASSEAVALRLVDELWAKHIALDHQPAEDPSRPPTSSAAQTAAAEQRIRELKALHYQTLIGDRLDDLVDRADVASLARVAAALGLPLLANAQVASAGDPLRELLAEKAQRADGATNGPWIVVDLPATEHGPRVLWLETDADALLERGGSCELRTIAEIEPTLGSRANFDFLAHARTDVPQLVAALRAVLDRTDEWKSRASRMEAKADDEPTVAGLWGAYSIAATETRAAIGAALNPQETTDV